MEETQKKPKRKPTKIEDMTKEQIRQAIIKKRECNAKALQIVESLLENCVNEDYLLKCLPDINQSHFEDVIEERSILHLCGYPLCQKTITQNEVPKQKYRISIRTNKVYDITARKSFCSNSCYKSAMHIKKQLLTSPLWFREYEEIPTFNLLPVDTIGSLGQEVDLGVTKIDLQAENHFTSINDFANASLGDFNEGINSHKKQKNDTTKSSSLSPQLENTEIDKSLQDIQTKMCKVDNMTNNNKGSINTNMESKKEQPKKNVRNPLNIVGEVIERPEKKIDPILLNPPCSETANKPATSKKEPQTKQKIITTLIIEVEKCLAEWFTIDTLLYLFGESKVKEMVADKGDCIKEYLNNYSQTFLYNSYMYDQYQALCKKLNMLELEDRQYDSKTLSKETKPLPSYSILKEESKKMQLKVKAFFSGETEIPEIEPDEAETNEEEATPNLPLVDKNAQNALRRKIVCQHLNKVLPDLLRSLGLLTLTISSDVRILVNTFKLKANNIMFKPVQWTLIAIIFIKLLSLRDPRLKHLLEQSTAFNHMQLLLLSYQQDGGYLDRLIIWLTDVDRLLDANDTQLTVG
ncbi:putative RNA polymerase II subunit B1 CTD phosphatase RPAP2 [Aricia agestis]|uniref:putative RNA polymerase II subunit B1 CTD phosphatase RPAP2 n=1 Tax=Aricia agestis TaxID=91739 RepID=UPI001C204B28|nr:putative RNA polymerase II subunit B1 CTD phosphatase RPAP2 [Aricia agestis]